MRLTVGRCATCATLLYAGDVGLLDDDGNVLCAAHAPTWRELIRRYETSDSPVLKASLDFVRASAEMHVQRGGSLDDTSAGPLKELP